MTDSGYNQILVIRNHFTKLENTTDKTRKSAQPLVKQIWSFLEEQLEVAEEREMTVGRFNTAANEVIIGGFPEDWCKPQNMEGLEYLLVEPACEVNEKGTREKNGGNEDVSMDDNEKIEVDSDKSSFAEEDWNDPEQNEVPKWTESDQPMTTGLRQGDRKRTGMRYNRYGDDFLIGKTQPDEISEESVIVGELVADEEWQIINDSEPFLQEDYSVPEREVDLEQNEIERRENTNLRVRIGCITLKLIMTILFFSITDSASFFR